VPSERHAFTAGRPDAAGRPDVSTEVGAREGLSSVTRGTLYLLLATLGYVALNFVARVVIVRSVSTEDWNAFSLALTLAGVIAAVGTLGLPSAIARSLPYVRTDDERRGIVRGSIVIGAGASVGSSLVLWALGPWIAASLGLPALGTALTVFPIAVGTTVAISLIAAIFQGYEDVGPNALYAQVVPPALFVAFLAAVYVAPSVGLSFESALLAYVASNVVALLLAIVYTVRRLPRLLAPGPRAPGAVGRLTRFAVPLLFVGVMSTVSGSGDTLVLGVFHPTAVGAYTVSLTLARLLQVGIGAASYIFLPVAARFLRTNDVAAIELTYVTITKWLLLLSLPLFLLFLFLPSRSLDFVYGPQYAHVIAPLQIVVLGAFVTTLLGPAANAQVAFGQTRLLAYNATAAGLLDLGLAFVLVPAYGIPGAAAAWASANIAYTGLSLAELAWITRVQPFRPHLVVPLVVTAVPVALVLAFAPVHYPLWSLPALAIGIAGLFVLVMLLTRSVDEGDRLLLGAIEGLLGRPLPLLRRLGRLGLPRSRS
jgi:O-antigen/teichoic acid export membrane protein